MYIKKIFFVELRYKFFELKRCKEVEKRGLVIKYLIWWVHIWDVQNCILKVLTSVIEKEFVERVKIEKDLEGCMVDNNWFFGVKEVLSGYMVLL